jgi:hypothetical protein
MYHRPNELRHNERPGGTGNATIDQRAKETLAINWARAGVQRMKFSMVKPATSCSVEEKNAGQGCFLAIAKFAFRLPSSRHIAA